MKRIFKILIWIFIALLIIYNVVLIINKLQHPYEIPDFFGYKSFIILSGSMEDEINIGDIIYVKEKSEIHENDIISFNENGAIITHRVIEIVNQQGEEFYKTKGDANASIDTQLISKDKIEGVYCFKIPKIGTIILFLQSKVGLIVFLIFLLALYVFLNRFKFKSKTKGRHFKK